MVFGEGYDSQLLAVLIRLFIRAIFSSLRRRARACGILRGQYGAVAFVQRLGSGLNLHPHVHVLVLDGVFAGLEGESPRFYPLRAPDDPDGTAVAETTSRRTQVLQRWKTAFVFPMLTTLTRSGAMELRFVGALLAARSL